MSKIIKITLASLVSVLLSVSTSNASGLDDFAGVSIGVVGAQADFDSSGTEFDPGATADTDENNKGSVSETVDYAGVFVEISTGAEGGSGFGITVGGEWIPVDGSIGARSRTDANDTQTPAANDATGTYTAKAEVENHLSAYIEPTYMFNNTFGVYGKAGLSKVTFNSLENLTNGDASTSYGNKDVVGRLYGAGVRIHSKYGLFAKVEYLATDYDEFTLNGTNSLGRDKKIFVDEIESRATRIAIGFNY